MKCHSRLLFTLLTCFLVCIYLQDRWGLHVSFKKPCWASKVVSIKKCWFEKKSNSPTILVWGKKMVFILFHMEMTWEIYFLRLEISQTLKETHVFLSVKPTQLTRLPRYSSVGCCWEPHILLGKEGAGMRGLLRGWAPKDL